MEAAAFLLRECETNLPKKISVLEQPTIPYLIYEQLAEIANRLFLFTRPITGAELIRLRNGEPGLYLESDNVSRAFFFLSVIYEKGYLPRNWKRLVEKNKVLRSTKTGKFATSKAISDVAFKYDVKTLVKSKHTNPWRIKLNIKEEIALSVKSLEK